MLDEERVVIVGQGYVGLPLALAAAGVGFRTFGFDNSQTRIKSIKSMDVSSLDKIEKTQLSTLINSNLYVPTNNPNCVVSAKYVIFCLPTPLQIDKSPDLTFLQSAMDSVGPFLDSDATLILESTSFPGTTRKHFRDYLVSRFPKLAHAKIAFSPERIDPNNRLWNIFNTPKLLAAIDADSLESARLFYSKFVQNLVTTSSIEVAEYAKLIENSYRLVNITLANEFMMMGNAMGINAREAIEAAATKPFGFSKFIPGAGIGGHCIPVDPVYLNWKADDAGYASKLISTAFSINSQMSAYVVNRWIELNIDCKDVLIYGVAYKEGIDDTRESPAYGIRDLIESFGIRVSWYDKLVQEFDGTVKADLSSSRYQAVIALHPIPRSDIEILVSRNVHIFDCTGSIPNQFSTQL
jgi:UDP-N-acetyl-D-glucosamine dehydrogenase